ncbi:hypothetical protein PENTCL1PPCAC_20004, partial [Pristionchus entomophagus]
MSSADTTPMDISEPPTATDATLPPSGTIDTSIPSVDENPNRPVASVSPLAGSMPVETAPGSSRNGPNYQLLMTLSGHVKGISSVKFSADGNYLASGSTDKTIRIWNTSDGKPIRYIAGHKLGISDVAWNPDGRLVCS